MGPCRARHSGRRRSYSVGSLVINRRSTRRNCGKASVFPDAKPSAPLVRVLPDLLAAAREHERTAALMPERKRASNSSKTVQRRRKALVEHRMLDPDPLRADEPKNLTQLTSHAEAAMTMSRRSK